MISNKIDGVGTVTLMMEACIYTLSGKCAWKKYDSIDNLLCGDKLKVKLLLEDIYASADNNGDYLIVGVAPDKTICLFLYLVGDEFINLRSKIPNEPSMGIMVYNEYANVLYRLASSLSKSNSN